MAQASSLLFVLGVIATAIGFAAHVGHAVLLANGRRVVALAPPVAPAGASRPAASPARSSRRAAVAASRAARRSPPRPPRCRAPPRSSPRSPSRCCWRRWSLRGDRGRARAVREPVRVQRRVRRPRSWAATCSSRGGTRSARSGSSRSAWRSRCCSTRRRCRRDIEPLVPALQNAPAAHHPRRDGGDLVRDLRDRVRRGRRVPRPGHRRPVRLAAVAQHARRGGVPRR